MQDDAKERMLTVLDLVCEAVSRFAQDSYGMHGRGITQIRIPDFPSPGNSAIVLTDMVYHTLADLRDRLANAPDPEDADVMIRMIETYDPATQAAVSITVGSDNPFTVKMRLQEPFVRGRA